MVKYLIIAGIFGWVALYSLYAVFSLGLAALIASAQPERKVTFGLFLFWGGVLFVSTLVSAVAICRIVKLRRRAQEAFRGNR